MAPVCNPWQPDPEKLTGHLEALRGALRETQRADVPAEVKGKAKAADAPAVVKPEAKAADAPPKAKRKAKVADAPADEPEKIEDNAPQKAPEGA